MQTTCTECPKQACKTVPNSYKFEWEFIMADYSVQINCIWNCLMTCAIEHTGDLENCSGIAYSKHFSTQTNSLSITMLF